MANVIQVYAPIRSIRRGTPGERSETGTRRRLLPGGFDRHPQHPANPAYKWPAGEVCICEGDGMGGRPPISVFDGSRGIKKLLANGALVRLAAGETPPAADTSDSEDLATLGLSARVIATLGTKGIDGVMDLVKAMKANQGPGELGMTENVYKGTRDQLVARGLLKPVDD